MSEVREYNDTITFEPASCVGAMALGLGINLWYISAALLLGSSIYLWWGEFGRAARAVSKIYKAWIIGTILYAWIAEIWIVVHVATSDSWVRSNWPLGLLASFVLFEIIWWLHLRNELISDRER